MGRKGAIFAGGWRSAGNGISARILARPPWPLGVKGRVLAATVLGLLGLLTFAAMREMAMPARGPAPEASRPTPKPQKPAFTRAEEAYIQALWPIHSEIERSTVRLSLGKIFYKIKEIGKAELKTRADESLAVYQRAEMRARALQPPPSLERAHDDYLAAIGLLQASALESLEMFHDGNEDHLLAAYPLSQQGSDKIRALGVKFWEDEFPPN
jgi:hypothetical protein